MRATILRKMDGVDAKKRQRTALVYVHISNKRVTSTLRPLFIGKNPFPLIYSRTYPESYRMASSGQIPLRKCSSRSIGVGSHGQSHPSQTMAPSKEKTATFTNLFGHGKAKKDPQPLPF